MGNPDPQTDQHSRVRSGLRSSVLFVLRRLLVCCGLDQTSSGRVCRFRSVCVPEASQEGNVTEEESCLSQV